MNKTNTLLAIIANAGKIETRKKLQKLIYLLQKRKIIEPVFKFEFYRYGPYSSDLQDRLVELKYEDLVKEAPVFMGTNLSYEYKLTSVGHNAITRDTYLEKSFKNNKDLLDTLHASSPSELEGIATLVFCSELIKKQSKHTSDKDIIKMAKTKKGEKFDDTQLASWLKKAKELELV